MVEVERRKREGGGAGGEGGEGGGGGQVRWRLVMDARENLQYLTWI